MLSFQFYVSKVGGTIMRKKYKRTMWRAIIDAVLTVLLGISLAFLGNWDSTQKYFVIKIIVFIVLSLMKILYIGYCAADNSKEFSLISELSKENSSLKKALSGIILVSQYNSSEVNKCIHQYIEKKKIDKDVWNYKKACYHLCGTIFTFASELAIDSNINIEVSYVKLNEEIDGEIELYSYTNNKSQAPKLLNKKRNFGNLSATQYFDMKMFLENSSETRVLYGSNDINNNFYRTSDEREKHPQKYNQYIAIPVFCDNKKMIGLLQIACLYKCSLAEDKEILKEVADKYFVPYANLFLLLHKMNKALFIEIKRGV